MKIPTLKREHYKKELLAIYGRSPEAKLVENRYRVMRQLILKEYPSLVSIEKEKILDILKDIVYVDRMIRKHTEGVQEEEKTILSQDFQLKELDTL